MGGGRKTSGDARKSASIDVLRQWDFRTDGTGSGAGGSAESPCEMTRIVRFAASRGSEPYAGTLIRIVIGDPPYVMNGRSQLGLLTGDEADEIRACLEARYRVTGSVESYDASDRTGRLRIRGRRDTAR